MRSLTTKQSSTASRNRTSERSLHATRTTTTTAASTTPFTGANYFETSAIASYDLCEPAHSKQLPLCSKHIYLDLMPIILKKIESKLLLLGANIEKCLSKEANYMITDSGHPRDYKGKRKPLESLLESPSPNIPTPNSSPSSFANIPLSRGQAIASLANTTKYYGSANAVSNAKRMGIKVIHIDTASTYVNNELRKLEKQRKTGSIPSSSSVASNAKKLKLPVCKISTDLFQPIIISSKYYSASLKSFQKPFDRHKSDKKIKLQSSYCEICNTDFPIMSKHLKSTSHRNKINDPNHYEALDTELSRCVSLEDLVATFT